MTGASILFKVPVLKSLESEFSFKLTDMVTFKTNIIQGEKCTKSLLASN